MSLKTIFIYGLFHRIISTNLVSRCFGKFANAKLNKSILRFLIRNYISIFKIEMEEYDLNIRTVTTFNEFFTRKLKPGARKWEEGICSPVDGWMLSYGPITKGKVFQVKGMDYAESELTGQKPMDSGSFVNLYLSPANYHRIHAPFKMQINKVTHIPGKLLSVSKKNAQTIDNLYTKNERVVLSGQSEFGDFHFVLVGALNVGSIRLSFIPDFRTNVKYAQKYTTDVVESLEKGQELGYFEMGSTVILLLQSEKLNSIRPEQMPRSVQMGNQLTK